MDSSFQGDGGTFALKAKGEGTVSDITSLALEEKGGNKAAYQYPIKL